MLSVSSFSRINFSTYCCEKPISANGDGQFFAARVHSPDDSIELLHEELQLALV